MTKNKDKGRDKGKKSRSSTSVETVMTRKDRKQLDDAHRDKKANAPKR